MRAALPVAALAASLLALALPAGASDAMLPVLLEPRAAEGVPPSFAPPQEPQGTPFAPPPGAGAAQAFALFGAAAVTIGTLWYVGRRPRARGA